MNYSKRIIINLLVVYALISSLVAPVGAAKYSDTAYLAEKSLPSTVLVYSSIDFEAKVFVPWTTGAEEYTVTSTVSSMGSGFFVNSDGYIITNGHVVFCMESSNYKDDSYTQQELMQDATAQLIQYVQTNEGYTFTNDDIQYTLQFNNEYGSIQSSLRSVYIILGEATGDAVEAKRGYSATVVSADPFLGRDLALLKTELTQTPSLLILDDPESINVGDSVYALGYPGVATFHPMLSSDTLLTPTFTMGIVSAKRLTARHISAIQHNAEVTHGNSGGPLVNSEGYVVGANNMGSISDLGLEVAGFNFAIASNVIKDFLRENGVTNGVGSTTTEYEKGLAYYYANMYGSAKKQFQDVQTIFPYHWRAQQLAQECQSKITSGQKAESEITITGPSAEVTAGKTAVTILGSMSHKGDLPLPVNISWPNPAVTMKITKPDGSTQTKNIIAGSDGAFEETFTPDVDGEWKITASWNGNEDHAQATSQSLSIPVAKAGFGVPGFPLEALFLGVLATVALILFNLRRAQPLTIR